MSKGLKPNFLLLFYSLSIFSLGICQKCNINSKECSNGECIEIDQWCDGRPDCADSSDETESACFKNRCPSYAFRCSYGACISKNLRCNKVNDCIDGSDESQTECLGKLQTGICAIHLLQCENSTQCIEADKACDGKKDCPNGSDETVNQCSSVRCPRYAFRCAYGACILKNQHCNGIEDCADGSDEINCGNNKQPLSTTTTRFSKVTTVAPSETDCFVPYYNESLILKTISTEIPLSPGTYAPLFTDISYMCLPSYFLSGPTSNFCDGSWINPHPKCSKMCPPIKDYTITATCEYKGSGVPCDQPVEPGTSAKLFCAVEYELPKKPVQNSIVCQKNGRWSTDPFQCEQKCGQVYFNIPFSVGGEITEIAKVPWTTAIYQLQNDGSYKLICGGTIIYSRIIISAAHCFWDLATSKLHNKSLFKVVVGKNYRDYNAKEKNTVQFLDISRILVPELFNGPNYDFLNDIAVVTVKGHIKFQNHIKPACLSKKSYSEKIVDADIWGTVSGWGIIEDKKEAEELRYVNLQTIDKATCDKRLPRNSNVPKDKFCVETGFGKNVCQGDSGGGFIVPVEINHKTYHTLYGIVSHGVNDLKNGVHNCDEKFITTFTNIHWFDREIESAYKQAYSEDES